MAAYMIVISLLFFVLIVKNTAEFSCPSKCVCEEKDYKVVCDNRNLTAADVVKISKTIDANTRKLDFSRNKIEEFSFVLVSNLTELKLAYNPLGSVPKNLSAYFPALETLDLSAINLKDFTKADFSGLKNLEKLLLDHNSMKNMKEGSFQELSNLLLLSLADNQISTVERGVFKGLNSLVTLGLENNQMTTIPLDLFDSFDSPQLAVNIPFNKIQKIPNGLFTKLKSFQMLDLANNSIVEIEDEAFKNLNLTNLNLVINELTKLPMTAFEGFFFSNLVLEDNPLNCDCQFADLLIGLKSKNKQAKVYGVCNSPSDVENEVVLDLFKKDSTKDLQKTLCTGCDLNNTCLNGATCVPVNKTKIECRCTGKYKGVYCQFEISDCQDGKCSKRIRTIVLSVCVVVLILLVIIIIAIYFVRKQRNDDRTETDGLMVDFKAKNNVET